MATFRSLLPYLYRGSSLVILCGFFLPWCGGASGFDFAQTKAYFELWGIVVVAIAFFLLPLFPLSRIRSAVGFIMGLAVVVTMIVVIRKFGIFREYGVWVTLTGGICGALLSLLEFGLNRIAKEAPPPG
jgi:hypothetical protein